MTLITTEPRGEYFYAAHSPLLAGESTSLNRAPAFFDVLMQLANKGFLKF